MRAVTISDQRLVITDRPDESPRAGEVLVRVRSASLNAADLMQLAGHYPAPAGVPADIPGLDLAGEVIDLGEGVTDAAIGDRVMAVVGGGAMAELCRVPVSHLLPVHDGADWNEAGALPEAITTAHDALFSQCRLAPGERLLVNGAAGGVGLAAVQMALAAGASVIASVRDAAVRERMADAIARHDEAALVIVDPAAVADQPEVDVVLELVGGPNLGPDLEQLRSLGRISIIGMGGGRSAELDLGLLTRKRARIHGSTLRSRSTADKAEAARRVRLSVLPLWRRGRLSMPVIASHPLADAEAAFERFRSGGKLGKIVLRMD